MNLIRSPWFLIAAVTFVRAVVAATTELVADEAYYVAWSERLAAGYLDHPPAVAWLIAAGTTLFGRTEIGVRAPALLSIAIATWVASRVVRALGGDSRAEWRTVAMISALPATNAAAVLMTPDTPLYLASVLALWAGISALRGDKVVVWVLFGLALGAAALSKLTAGLLVVSLLFVASRPLRPRAAIALGVAAVVASPFFAWNIANDFVPFTFQARRIDFVFTPGNFFALAAGQLAIVTPCVVALVVSALRKRRTPGAHVAFLRWSTVLPLALFGAISLTAHVEPNWPAPAWTGALCLAAVDWPETARWARLRYTVVLPAVVSAALIALVWIGPASIPNAARLRGHRAFAARVAAATDAEMILVPSYQTASLLRFYLPPGKTAWSTGENRRPSQYGLWPWPVSKRTAHFDEEGRPSATAER